jgi:hypothetical protein
LDFRKKGGTQEQFALAKRDKLYKQDYCGCLFALKKQREFQGRLTQELLESVNAQLLPNSLSERIELYRKRYSVEKEGVKYDIVKEGFLNYRLLRAYIKVDRVVRASYFLAYSHLKRKKAKVKISKKIGDIFYSNKEEIRVVSLKTFNKIANTSYGSVKELYFSPLSFQEECKLRVTLENSFFSTSAFVVVDSVNFSDFEIYCDSILYQDVRENLVIF